MMLIHFEVDVTTSGEKPNYHDELLKETKGILVWALAGLRRLMTNNAFTEPAASAAAKAQYRLESSPVAQFVDECLTVGVGLEVDKQLAYSVYRQWAIRRGEKPLEYATFGRDLKRAVPGMGSDVQHGSGAERKRFYSGVAFAGEDTRGSTAKPLKPSKPTRLPFRQSTPTERELLAAK
jgi:putative DNA primase/helicase